MRMTCSWRCFLSIWLPEWWIFGLEFDLLHSGKLMVVWKKKSLWKRPWEEKPLNWPIWKNKKNNGSRNAMLCIVFILVAVNTTPFSYCFSFINFHLFWLNFSSPILHSMCDCSKLSGDFCPLTTDLPCSKHTSLNCRLIHQLPAYVLYMSLTQTSTSHFNEYEWLPPAAPSQNQEIIVRNSEHAHLW